jgi:hypothetical protein
MSGTIIPATNDITIYQGATFNPVYTYKDANGVAINLTGYTAEFQAREQYGSQQPFINLTTSNGGITLGGSAGTITLLMSAAATAALTVLGGVQDLLLVDGSGVATRLWQGALTVNRNVSR